MFCFKEALPPSAFIILVSLITSIRCDSFAYAIEGESVQLNFIYPCNSTRITLQYGNRLPFYSVTNPDILELNRDLSERFTVENTTEGDHCFLQLSIGPVKRLDGGTYILLAYIGNYITRIDLHVDFLPGRAHCSFGGRHGYEGDWKELHCIATAGSMLGYIQCYQRGLIMPFLSAPSENNNTLEQTILVRKNRHHVYCCSSQLIEPKERCDCNDYVWDPLSQGEVRDPGDPCPTSTHVPTAHLTTSYHHDHSSSTLRAIIPTKGEIQDEICPTNTFMIVLIIIFAMMMTFFFTFIQYLTQYKFRLQRSNVKQDSSKETLVP